MEDVTVPPSKVPVKKATAPLPRSSAVSRHVDPIFVLNKVLNTEMTLPVGELLGVSKEVSTRLTDLLKVTHIYVPPVLLLREQSPLIQVLVTCNRKSIMAIIDTGATQNVCSTRVWREQINLPMD
ncbi:hypothetical protein BYT27DRAFT_7090366, partial [Phlegmacium glaucopus]